MQKTPVPMLESDSVLVLQHVTHSLPKGRMKPSILTTVHPAVIAASGLFGIPSGVREDRGQVTILHHPLPTADFNLAAEGIISC